ncbi:malonic semialdehyde reductase [Corallococcus sp. H22C18031201]|uniref:malonic semialdehyde reductase n=1 Tax=Citreicoccus inhibens TaxID=2849499 RepID=UPI000E7543B3|nr:malonic semialdehyde reductase [Citreicoccus inhibens]MBU8897512.1 malonic semialdehyde reductase [Citreicoccus inhibens]RJS19602.1 malonic semialdehyde reductase [Corallococcus sp. H22C18031201]
MTVQTTPTLAASALDQLFRDARTHFVWHDEPVADSVLRELYALTRMAPTAANAQPLRIVFVKSPEAKARLKPALTPGNVDKTMTAPVTAILAYDTEFYEKLPKLFPARDMRTGFANMPPAARAQTAVVNASLQGGYLIMAARALGLDCGPMAGFDAGKVDAEFFPDGKWKTVFLLNLGHGDATKLFPRNPRLDFEEACRIE